jgi:hypothetical protein
MQCYKNDMFRLQKHHIFYGICFYTKTVYFRNKKIFAWYYPKLKVDKKI